MLSDEDEGEASSAKKSRTGEPSSASPSSVHAPPPQLPDSLGAGPASADEPQLPASAMPAHVEKPAEGVSGVEQSEAPTSAGPSSASPAPPSTPPHELVSAAITRSLWATELDNKDQRLSGPLRMRRTMPFLACRATCARSWARCDWRLMMASTMRPPAWYLYTPGMSWRWTLCTPVWEAVPHSDSPCQR